MIAATPEMRVATAREHIRLMRALGGELRRAMLAISQNDLLELEDSIANQQALGFALTEIADLSGPAPNGRTIEVTDPDLEAQIRAAMLELQDLNLRYSILLQRSSRSMAQMASLFSSVQAHLQEETGSGLRNQTLSCQV